MTTPPLSSIYNITGSTVYLQRRPFHPDRFADLIEDIASANYAALENTLTLTGAAVATREESAATSTTTAAAAATTAAAESKEELTQVVTGLLRSKGFVWLACTDQAALYFSHAGMYVRVYLCVSWMHGRMGG